MTRAERDALRVLEAKATPGPIVYNRDEAQLIGGGWTIAELYGENLVDDANCLAAARNNIVALLDALDDAEEQLRLVDAARVQYRRERDVAKLVVDAARDFDGSKDGDRWSVLLARMHSAIAAYDKLGGGK